MDGCSGECEYENDKAGSAGEMICGTLRRVVFERISDELGPGGYTCWCCSSSFDL